VSAHRYRKKPVVIEAMKWDGTSDSFREITDWADDVWGKEGASLIIPTLEGDHQAMPGDWIIKGVKGEFYPCKPDIFEATYEEVS
jgi:hypothetical protein